MFRSSFRSAAFIKWSKTYGPQAALSIGYTLNSAMMFGSISSTLKVKPVTLEQGASFLTLSHKYRRTLMELNRDLVNIIHIDSWGGIHESQHSLFSISPLFLSLPLSLSEDRTSSFIMWYHWVSFQLTSLIGLPCLLITLQITLLCQ